MAGIYEALVRADRERNPTASSAPAGGWTDPSHDLAAVGAMLERLENRVETELADNYDERFEHFASLEVSIGALEDRLDDREREHKTSSADLATIVARKMLYKRAFPQNSADLAPNSANIVNTADSSEYLYWLLTNGTTFGVPSEGDGRFLASELGDTDGDGLIELIDGWGEPLRFYRWPTRLIRPQGLNQTSLSPQDLTRTRFLMGDGNAQRFLQDPDDDPLATFDKWIRNQQQAASRKALEIEFHTPSTWHSPLIVSLGSDKLLGLLEPGQTVVFGHLGFPTNQASAIYDNITNLNIPSTGN